MAIAQFAIFGHVFGVSLEPSMPEFWFMMQIAMIAGFFYELSSEFVVDTGWRQRTNVV